MFSSGNQVMPADAEQFKRVNSLDRVIAIDHNINSENADSDRKNVPFDTQNFAFISDDSAKSKETVSLRPKDLREALHLKLAKERQRQVSLQYLTIQQIITVYTNECKCLYTRKPVEAFGGRRLRPAPVSQNHATLQNIPYSNCLKGAHVTLVICFLYKMFITY